MKKLFVISLLLLGFTACHKADIKPNTSAGSFEQKSAITSNGGETSGNSSIDGNSTSSSTTTTTTSSTNPNSGETTDGTITDPLRKKDQRDNR